jgi:hypothetical protein
MLLQEMITIRGSNDSQDFSIGKASSTVVTVWYPFIQVQHKLQLP